LWGRSPTCQCELLDDFFRNLSSRVRASLVEVRVPTDRLNLTDEEIALLPDPDWVTEDDADFIIAVRAERKPGRRASLEQVLLENGIKVYLENSIAIKRCVQRKL
jgi:hypothetical protein